jgi:uncharacterized UBP type Zn finger protein
MAACGHLDGIVPDESGLIGAPPSADGCEDCLAIGSTWVHLRRCLECGHVGCCDSSPHRHATAHHRSSGHPVIQSFEPGEEWLWCYEHDLGTNPATDVPSPSHS